MATTESPGSPTAAKPSTHLAERIEELRRSRAYTVYRDVRERVFAMKDRDAALTGRETSPSEYWSEELQNFEYMVDASPLIIEKLCQHTFHVTGIRLYEYRS